MEFLHGDVEIPIGLPKCPTFNEAMPVVEFSPTSNPAKVVSQTLE